MCRLITYRNYITTYKGSQPCRFLKILYIYTMEAKPLEMIPEDRVTSDVPKTKPATAKNPGRVASGKRLAERNRLAREAKKQAEAQKPPTNNTTTTNQETNQSSSPNTTNNISGYLILGVGGLIVSALGVYYQREAIMRTLGRSTKTQTTQPPYPIVDAVDPSPAIVRAPKRRNREME